ncbi:MAG: hypothetical protein AC479_05485 [miscellaneous Crenarchaeota group-6 archaeon AD8-1]|nr:MAG: hypothetical protein AC479_05485 [miscellaneous Crenarchaeota group-6 archaeon AD8-1]
MKSSTSRISIFAIFAALYSILVIFLAPISYGFIQVRIADALLPLSMIFGLPSILGFTIGNVVANFYGGLGLIDIIGGSLANFIACSLAWYIASKSSFVSRLIGSLTQTIIITLIVGGYLWILFEVPVMFSLIGVLLGSIISINLLGFPIEELLRENKVIRKYLNLL